MQKEKPVTYPYGILVMLAMFKLKLEHPDHDVDPKSPVYASAVYKGKDGRSYTSQMQLDVSKSWDDVSKQIISFLEKITKEEDITFDYIDQLFPDYNSAESKSEEPPEEIADMLHNFFMEAENDCLHLYGSDSECYADILYEDSDSRKKEAVFPVDVLKDDAESRLLEQMDKLLKKHKIGYSNILCIKPSYYG